MDSVKLFYIGQCADVVMFYKWKVLYFVWFLLSSQILMLKSYSITYYITVKLFLNDTYMLLINEIKVLCPLLTNILTYATEFDFVIAILQIALITPQIPFIFYSRNRRDSGDAPGRYFKT